jgi:hypothetical protein
MQTATRVLVLGGLANLIFALLFGLLVSRTKLVDSEGQEVPVSDVHTGTLVQGVILLSLVVAVQLSPLRARVESGAAGLLALGSLFHAIASILAWRNGYPSPLSVRGAAYQTAVVGAALSILGMLVLGAGVLKSF